MASTNWFTWFLRSPSWLRSWIIRWTMHETIFRDILHQWIVVWIISWIYYSALIRGLAYLIMMLRSFDLYLLQLFMQFRRKTLSIIYVSSSWSDILVAYLYSLLLWLLQLLIYNLWILLVVGYMYSFHILIILLYQNVLVRIRIFSWEESLLCLAFSAILNHSLFGSWTLTFSNMRYSFKTSNLMHSLQATIYALMNILLLS